MAAKRQQQTTETTPTETTPTETTPEQQTAETSEQEQRREHERAVEDELAHLRAQRKALDEAIKAKRAAQPRREKPTAEQRLAKLIAYQTEHPMDAFLLSKIRQRVELGQDRETAIAAVWDLTRAWLVEQLDRKQGGE